MTRAGRLAAAWTCAHSAGRSIEVARFTVESVEIDPAIADADFVPPIPPGSIVGISTFPEAGQGLDPNKPASGKFGVDPAGKWMPLEETGFTTGDGLVLPPEVPSRRWWWGAAVVGVAVVALLGIPSRRRFRRVTEG